MPTILFSFLLIKQWNLWTILFLPLDWMWCKGAWIAERCHIVKMRIYNEEKPELTRGKNAEKKEWKRQKNEEINENLKKKNAGNRKIIQKNVGEWKKIQKKMGQHKKKKRKEMNKKPLKIN